MMKLCLCIKEELGKVLFLKKGLIVILISFIIHMVICIASAPEMQRYTFDTEIYKYYTVEFGGVYSENTQEKIDSEMKIQQKIASEQLKSDVMSSDEYIEHVNRTAVAAQKLSALEAIQEKYSFIKKLSKYDAELTYDIEFTEYCRKFRQDWIALVCIAILTISVVFGDIRCGMDKLLYSSKMGRNRILKSKLWAIGIISLIIPTLFSLVQIIIISGRWEFGSLDAPIQSFTGFDNCKLQITARQGLVLGIVFKSVFSMVAALLLVLISSITKNEIISISTLTIVLAIGNANYSDRKMLPVNLSVYLSGINALMNEIISQHVFLTFVCAIFFLIAESFVAFTIQKK